MIVPANPGRITRGRLPRHRTPAGTWCRTRRLGRRPGTWWPGTRCWPARRGRPRRTAPSAVPRRRVHYRDRQPITDRVGRHPRHRPDLAAGAKRNRRRPGPRRCRKPAADHWPDPARRCHGCGSRHEMPTARPACELVAAMSADSVLSGEPPAQRPGGERQADGIPQAASSQGDPPSRYSDCVIRPSGRLTAASGPGQAAAAWARPAPRTPAPRAMTTAIKPSVKDWPKSALIAQPRATHRPDPGRATPRAEIPRARSG
jgi:hypothetical protein